MAAGATAAYYSGMNVQRIVRSDEPRAEYRVYVNGTVKRIRNSYEHNYWTKQRALIVKSHTVTL